ncbi:MAG: hypothetical protein J6D29_01905 [Solobacterium sp.]|nr:hypothetical protein [Solobacterium sp.]
MEIEKKKIDLLQLITYIYLFTPVFLFVTMWLKFYIGIPLGIAILVGIYFSLKNETPLWYPERNKHTFVFLGLVLAITVIWTFTSGVGSSVVQYPDHLYRNALFRILIDHEWPVKLTVNGNTKGMAYYIGFWLPAALVAKVSSYQFGFLFLQIWMIIGLFLILYYICEKHQKLRLWYILVFIVFGGADWIGYQLIGKAFDQLGNRIEWWAYVYNYPGVMTSTFWVYNQVIYGWLIFSMIMRQKDNRNILFLWSAGVLNCTFPAAGMIPFAIYRALRNTDEKEFFTKFGKAVTSCLSWQFLVGFLISLISTVYVLSNTNVGANLAIDNASKVMSILPTLTAEGATVVSFNAYPWTTRVYIYLWFVLLEFGLYFIVIYKSQNKKPIYWLTLIVLLACPLIEVGGWIDFCMRASIPGLFVLFHMVIDAFEDYVDNKKYVYVAILVLFSFFSSMTCHDTLMGVMGPMAQKFYNNEKVSADAFSESYVFNADNFFSSMQSPFFKYFAK